MAGEKRAGGLPAWNPEGFWRIRSSHRQRQAEWNHKQAQLKSEEAWRHGEYDKALDLEALPPVTILVGKRRAKLMRRERDARRG